MSGALDVEAIACLADNYAYLVVGEGRVAVVDPSEAGPVERALARRGLSLHEIWCTHHHPDHVGGVPELVRAHRGLVVRGSEFDCEKGRIPHQTHVHGEGDAFEFAGHRIDVLAIPGHTLGAIAFLGDGALFSGDTLFLGGCGRVFEGTMPMMASSMRKLRALPPPTRVYCGHEYTAANLRFARTVEPGNEAIAKALEAADVASRTGTPTVPGTLAVELETNPFLRFDRLAEGNGEPGDVMFARLREAKNSFRG